jgi:pSer/pThr/pTyr-binding forkhead associated (FHA) protein
MNFSRLRKDLTGKRFDLQTCADIIIDAYMARLVILSEGLTGKAHELTVDKTTIGRVDDNTFPIPEASVSSHHCEILLRGTDVVVRDLNSTNGTFINGNQVSGEAPLKPGQILRLGQIEMRLEDAAANKATAAKKLPDQTMVIPQGVKLGQEPSTTVTFDKSTFTKKSNTGTKIFIGVIIAIGVVVLVLILLLFKKF